MDRSRRYIGKDTFFAWLLLLPATLILAMVRFWPMLQGIAVSFTNRRLFGDTKTKFIGVDNYVQLFNDKEFWKVSSYTLIYTLGVVILSYFLGLVIALLMNMKINGRGIFRCILLIPWVIPSVVAAYIWRYALNDQIGIFNMIIQSLGLSKAPIGFLAVSQLTQIMVIVIAAWKNYPFMGLVLLAGLQNVPEETKESARIDGANAFQVFRYVTWPHLKGVSTMCTTLMFIWTFNNFDNIFLLTGGGPNYSTIVMSIHAYYAAFQKMTMGYATTIGSVMLVFMLIVTRIYIKFINGKES